MSSWEEFRTQVYGREGGHVDTDGYSCSPKIPKVGIGGISVIWGRKYFWAPRTLFFKSQRMPFGALSPCLCLTANMVPFQADMSELPRAGQLLGRCTELLFSLPRAWNLAPPGFSSEDLTLGDPSLLRGLRGWRRALPKGTVEQEKGQT